MFSYEIGGEDICVILVIKVQHSIIPGAKFPYYAFLLQIIKKVPQLRSAICSAVELNVEHPPTPSLWNIKKIAKMRSKIKREYEKHRMKHEQAEYV